MSENKKELKIKERREERQEAFELLFERISREDSIEDSYEDAVNARDLKLGDYTKKLVEGVSEHKEELDKMIEENLKGWRMSRISKVALTALRMALYEMRYLKEIPVSVSINEAVELTKTYAVPKEGSFVNGLLGAVAVKMKGDS